MSEQQKVYNDNLEYDMLMEICEDEDHVTASSAGPCMEGSRSLLEKLNINIYSPLGNTSTTFGDKFETIVQKIYEELID